MKSFLRSLLHATALAASIMAAPYITAQTLVTSATPQIAALDLPEAPIPQTLFQEPAQQPAAQQPAASSSQPPVDEKQEEQEKKRLEHEEAERQLAAQEHQRIGGIVPNFNAVMNGSAVPLSAGQKMRAAFRSAVDPYQFVLAGIASAYGQATDSHSSIDSNGLRHGYEQGFVGYTKRFGSSFADQFNGTILGNGAFPALLHQDPRYFRMGSGPVKSRLWYSILSTVRCKGDNGKWQPNASNLLGNLAAGGISNVYYPKADRGFALTIEQGLTVTAEGAFGAMLIEFYPDIQKHLFHKKDKSMAAQPTHP